MSSRSPEVDAFVAGQPEPFRTALAELRDAIHEIVPDASERITYGIPVVTLNGKNLVGFNAAKEHYTLQVMSTGPIDQLTEDLAPYRTGKGSVQFSADAPPPRDLIEKLVLARVAENAERAAKRSG